MFVQYSIHFRFDFQIAPPENYRYIYSTDDALSPDSYYAYGDYGPGPEESNTMRVTHEEFLMVLAKLDRLLIRATYHLRQSESV